MRSSLFAGLTILSMLLNIIVSAFPTDQTQIYNDTGCLKIVTRSEWGARKPKDREPLPYTPTPYVVVHHGGIRKYCYDQKACSAIVRSYQDLHMDDRGWFDIGYNFVIGEDGNAYEGRGWNSVGAHAPGYNTQSIGICVIGDFSDFLPNKAALTALNSLIAYGVKIGKINKEYKVLGHRQARNTLCPGETFFKYVQALPHWTSKPVPIYSNQTTTDRTVIMNENTVETGGIAQLST